MAGSSNGKGQSPDNRGLPQAPNMFCLFCCQLFKAGQQEQIKPAITLVPIAIPATGLWVTVPTCIDHLETPRTSPLIH